MTERVPVKFEARLIEILPVDQNHDPSVWVCRECFDSFAVNRHSLLTLRHLAGTKRKPRASLSGTGARKPFARKLMPRAGITM
jgi:hypothetical protein